jgi:hypothetical protein
MSPGARRLEILGKLDKGEISVEEAVELLKRLITATIRMINT